MAPSSINESRLEVQKEVVGTFAKNNYNGFAKVPTGTGKAWILIQILKNVKPKTCWYLCDSTKNRDVTFKKELKKWGASRFINKIEFMCYQTAYKLEGYNVDIVLADEADFGLTDKYSDVFRNNTFKHKVLVSGTMSKEKYTFLNEFKIPLIYNIELTEAEDRGVLNKANYYIVKYLMSKKESGKYIYFNKLFARILNSPFKNARELETLQINRKHFLSRLDSSVNVCRKLISYLYQKRHDNKILIFSGLSEQANRICKYTYHSGTDDVNFNMFDSGEIRVLGVVSKADRGLNINGVNCIILESPSKSPTKFRQRTGRGRRLAVDDVLDVFFLVPYYTDISGRTKPTIVYKWVFDSANKIDNFNPKVFKF